MEALSDLFVLPLPRTLMKKPFMCCILKAKQAGALHWADVFSVHPLS
jgi:hypothetical protein